VELSPEKEKTEKKKIKRKGEKLKTTKGLLPEANILKLDKDNSSEVKLNIKRRESDGAFISNNLEMSI